MLNIIHRLMEQKSAFAANFDRFINDSEPTEAPSHNTESN